MAQLHLASLKDKTSPKALKKALEALPEGLDALNSAYSKAIQRIQDQMDGFKKMAREVLIRLTYSERLMTFTEVLHALAIEESGSREFDADNLDNVDEMIAVCAGLVIVDETTQTIRLVHYTTQDYLRRKGPQILPNANQLIATKCLPYLLYDVFGTGWISGEAENNSHIEQRADLSSLSCPEALKVWTARVI